MAPVDVLGFVLVFCLSIHGLQGADLWTIEGDSTILPCGITYDPTVNLFWQLQPANIIILLKHPGGRIEIREDQWAGRVEFVGSTDLRITNVSRQDDSAVVEGGYRLQGYQCSQPGSTVGERSHLHVRYPPSQVAITGYNSSSTLQPGDELQLSCNANDSNPAPSFAWYKNSIKIGEGRTININPIKLENNGDIIRCKVTVHDDREPVFHWEGQSQVKLSVKSGETGTNYGVFLGIGVAVVTVLFGVGAGVYFWRKRCNSSRSTDGNTGNTSEGDVALQDVVSEPPPTSEPNGHVPNGSLPAAADIIEVITVPDPAPGNQAEPGPDGSTSSDDADSLRPSTSHSDRPDLDPVQETAGPTYPEPQPPVETTPLMPQSDLDEMWDKVFDIVKDGLRSSEYRRRLGRKLNLSEVDLSAIEEDHRQAREKLHQILLLWRERNPNDSPADLAEALRKCQCNTVAKMVEQSWESYGSP